MIIITYVLIILIGAFLLSLPVSSTKGEWSRPLTALFTATSAVCVTGLSVVDIWSTFSSFGQFILLIMMETGGLGFMSVVTIIFHIVNHQEGIQALTLSAESLGVDNMKNLYRIQRRVILGSISFEAIGAFILFLCFLPVMGVPKALWYGVFHAVSSFCNAGFDLMGCFSDGSLISFQNNPAVLITISLLIIIGGLGFIVWDDMAGAKSPNKWSVNTRIVLMVTAALILFGTVFFLFLEYSNPATIGDMTLGDKIVNAYFQSVTTRTAGFAAIGQGDMSDSSVALTTFLMMIGGSAGSTAGGIKTATFLIFI
ncbi:MAG: potassium uptake protein, TrkH family, partial [Lachnospiraceae bacterium]|nr:potassium uptake protein, TrkH family [Lachnospiraceae bacterium]